MSGSLTVVNGAKLMCSLGAGLSQLIVTTPSLILIEGQPPATIMDHLSMINVPPFGGCSAKPDHICLPVLPTPWIVPMFTGVQLSTLSFPILPANARLPCAVGGIISVLDPNEHTVPVGQAHLMISQVIAAELEIEAIKAEVRDELIKAGFDTGGVFDPTPILDSTSALLSLKDGDFAGAGLSLLSGWLPYLGDALGKGAKAARLADKLEKLRDRLKAARALKRAAASTPTPKPINPQKQAGHIKGTPQHKNRLKAKKPTSTFDDPATAEQLTQVAWSKGTPVPGRPQMREYDFGRRVGTGPQGQPQTKVRVSIDAKGQIHGHPK